MQNNGPRTSILPSFGGLGSICEKGFNLECDRPKLVQIVQGNTSDRDPFRDTKEEYLTTPRDPQPYDP